MSKGVKLDELSRLLDRLGFSRTRQTGGHLVFQKTNGSGITIVVRSAAILPPTMVAYVRRALDENGVLGPNEFDRRLQHS